LQSNLPKSLLLGGKGREVVSLLLGGKGGAAQSARGTP